MPSQTVNEKRTQCPDCGKKAKRVSPVTLRALLKEEYAQSIEGIEQQSCCDAAGDNGSGCKSVTEDTGWRFCDSRGCDVVYFAEKGGAAFTKSQLKVAVGVKETSGQRPLCYCFGHTMASIKQKLVQTGRSDALEDIRTKMKDPGCHCETANPSGSCCLGGVAKGIKIAEQELGIAESNKEVDMPKSPSNRAEKIAKIGTMISAVMASSCCWLPLVLLAVGVSGAGIAATLEAYRPIFIVVTFGFLGMAFYYTYRPRKRVGGDEHGCCSPNASNEAGDCCATAGKRRFTMMTVNKVMLWAVTVLAVAFLFFPSYVGFLLGSGDGTTIHANMNRTVVRIEGMTCEGCAAIAEKAIRDVPGVLAVEVRYDKGEAVVGTEIGCPVPVQEILSALKAAGYQGTIY